MKKKTRLVYAIEPDKKGLFNIILKSLNNQEALALNIQTMASYEKEDLLFILIDTDLDLGKPNERGIMFMSFPHLCVKEEDSGSIFFKSINTLGYFSKGGEWNEALNELSYNMLTPDERTEALQMLADDEVDEDMAERVRVGVYLNSSNYYEMDVMNAGDHLFTELNGLIIDTYRGERIDCFQPNFYLLEDYYFASVIKS